MLRLLLPPNLSTAAPRDAIAVKVEIDLAVAPPAEMISALALLQSWCRSESPPPFVQLTRSQLQQLLSTLQGKPVFFWLNQPTQPIFWIGPHLRGVSEFLINPEAPKIAPSVPAVFRPGRETASVASGRRDVPANTSRRIEVTRESIPVSGMTVDGSEHFLSITLPSREQISYSAALEMVKTNGFALEPSNRKWWLRDRHKVLNFLARHRTRLEKEFFAEFTPNFEKNTARLKFAEIRADAISHGEGFNVTLALRAGRVSEDQILAAATANRGYVEDEKQIYLFAPEQLEQLAQAQRALAGDGGAGLATRRTHRVSAAQLAGAEEILEQIAPHFQPPAEWRTRSEALRNLSKLSPAPIPSSLNETLRPYQRVGAAWLWHLYQNKLGGILADEMGLGKTLQALALLCCIQTDGTKIKAASPVSSNSSGRRRPSLPSEFAPLDASTSIPSSTTEQKYEALTTPRRIGPALVVCPASLVENWRREAARFAPQLRVFVHHGSNRIESPDTALAHDLIVTSYGTLARNRELFETVDFAALIADEAQHLKNRRTQNAQTLRALTAKGRFLLTGTPLENSLEDLRSLFEVLMPGLIEAVPSGTRGEERNWYDDRLRAKTAPYILRRTKQAVAPELPEKIEQVIYCELSPTQSALYRRIQEESERSLLDLEAKGASENSIRFATLTQLLRLRQVCCDPRLLPGGTHVPVEELSDNQKPKPSTVDSAKLEAFRELLSEAIDDGHRLLVFSQFTSLLALLREELEAQQIAYCHLDGSMSPKARQVQVDAFNEKGEAPVFLISLKAGGTGLNLTGADTVVHFDPWWNPAVEAQATDRAHRIGQTRVVTSYKLICSGTVEEKVLQLQASKRALLEGVFDASDAATAKISLVDLRELIH